MPGASWERTRGNTAPEGSRARGAPQLRLRRRHQPALRTLILTTPSDGISRPRATRTRSHSSSRPPPFQVTRSVALALALTLLPVAGCADFDYDAMETVVPAPLDPAALDSLAVAALPAGLGNPRVAGRAVRGNGHVRTPNAGRRGLGRGGQRGQGTESEHDNHRNAEDPTHGEVLSHWQTQPPFCTQQVTHPVASEHRMTHGRACAGVGAKTVNIPRTTTTVPIAQATFFIPHLRLTCVDCTPVQALPGPARDRMRQRHRPPPFSFAAGLHLRATTVPHPSRVGADSLLEPLQWPRGSLLRTLPERPS